MEMKIRPVCLADAAAIHELRHQPGVLETVLSIPGERITDTEAFLAGLSEHDYLLVAVLQNGAQEKVIGLCGLQRNRRARQLHSAVLGIMVDAEQQGKGVGRALLREILTLADQWLMLLRVELNVFTDNKRAIALYESMGFSIEGTRKYAAIKNGAYADEHLMARYCLS
ncbi:GNAT family N-acetyltransferase [Azotosporobacter soli]|uniref:GNAT family N-acetyltransferase n=1 Tax=Azotosporobacter soli TaxID=3055040 RepID=UPI0031FEC1B7